LGEKQFEEKYEHYKTIYLEIADELEKQDYLVLEKETTEKNAEHKMSSYLYEGNERCVEILRNLFTRKITEDENLIFMGEDVCDPYGGAFKVTKGMSLIRPFQIFNMPISEACMVGIGVGMALYGKKPVVEMMFGDFITLGFDQLLNHAVKYAWVYGDAVKVPVIVRAPMGAKRGYGPTHSQSLEKFLIGIPMLRVLALSPLHNPGTLYTELFDTIESPTVVIENKKLYSERIANIVNNRYGIFEVKEINHYGYATLYLTIEDEQSDFVIITYGEMVDECINAAEQLMLEEELCVNIVVLSQLSPLPIEDIRECINPEAVTVTIEEGTQTGGIGAEIIASCVENRLGNKFMRIAMPDCPIPNGIVLEQQLVPNKQIICDKLKETIYGK
jgi:2-oxoisovalerate dehydrogenase E1 component